MNTVWRDGHWEVKHLHNTYAMYTFVYALGVVLSVLLYLDNVTDYWYITISVILLLFFGYKTLYNLILVGAFIYILRIPSVHTTFVTYEGEHLFSGPLSKVIFIHYEFLRKPRVGQTCLVINVRSKYYIHPM